MTRKISQLTLNTAPKGTDLIEVSEDLGGGSFGSKFLTLDQLGTQLGYILLQDRKTSATNGGTATAGSWETRVLNTEQVDTGNDCTLTANQFTLTPGTYEIEASAPAWQVNVHQARLFNVTDAVEEILGTVISAAAAAAPSTTNALVKGRFTITTAKVFQLEHRVQTTRANEGHGLGAGNTWGSNIFAEVVLRKVGGQHPAISTAMVGAVVGSAVTLPGLGVDWHLCDGSTLLRASYPTLFGLLGVIYGPGDGSTNFVLPDYRGQFLRGTARGSTKDPDRATRTDRGDGTTGDDVGTEQDSEVVNHSHTQDVNTVLGSGTGGSQQAGVSGTWGRIGTTSGAGGNETRGININVDWAIYSGPVGT